MLGKHNHIKIKWKNVTAQNLNFLIRKIKYPWPNQTYSYGKQFCIGENKALNKTKGKQAICKL